MLALVQSNPDGNALSWDSKLETMQEVKRAQGNMREVGLGIALILALIGILNYINTVTGNIQSRQRELAILESIGMTDRQRNRMLVTKDFCTRQDRCFSPRHWGWGSPIWCISP